MLLYRYKSLDYILSLDLESAFDFILTAMKKDREEKNMFRWIVGGYEKVYSFNDFINIIDNCNENENYGSSSTDKKTKNNILIDVRNIIVNLRG